MKKLKKEITMLSLRPRQNECLDAILTAYVEGLRQLFMRKPETVLE